MKKLQLHDTLSRKRLEIVPNDGSKFRFYCCGPTVYGPAHIGNFRAFLVQDFFRRVIELSGLKTLHVRNITDVDDKTIRESIIAGVSSNPNPFGKRRKGTRPEGLIDRKGSFGIRVLIQINSMLFCKCFSKTTTRAIRA